MPLVTTSTRISTRATIQRSRMLPHLGEVFVRVGQDVNPVQVIAQAVPDGGYFIFRASESFGVPESELTTYLLVEEGATLRKGSLLVQKKGKLGRSKLYKSPVNGVLTEIRNGCLIMQKAQEPIDLRAMMQGRVASIIPGLGVVLETRGAVIQAIWDSGKDGYGKLKTVVSSAAEPLNADRIKGDVRGSVLITGWISSTDDLNRLESKGIRGVIAGSMPADLCRASSSQSFPIVLTDGIGEYSMSEPIFQILQRAEGNEVSLLSGEKGIQGQKSEIIIPSPVSHTEEQAPKNPLEVGNLVRVLRWKKSHVIGRVLKIHHTPRRSNLGLMMTGADVEFGSGEIEFIPYTNLDLIT